MTGAYMEYMFERNSRGKTPQIEWFFESNLRSSGYFNCSTVLCFPLDPSNKGNLLTRVWLCASGSDLYLMPKMGHLQKTKVAFKSWIWLWLYWLNINFVNFSSFRNVQSYSEVFRKIVVLEILTNSVENTSKGIHIFSPCLQLCKNELLSYCSRILPLFEAIFQVLIVCKISRTAIFKVKYQWLLLRLYICLTFLSRDNFMSLLWM